MKNQKTTYFLIENYKNSRMSPNIHQKPKCQPFQKSCKKVSNGKNQNNRLYLQFKNIKNNIFQDYKMTTKIPKNHMMNVR